MSHRSNADISNKLFSNLFYFQSKWFRIRWISWKCFSNFLLSFSLRAATLSEQKSETLSTQHKTNQLFVIRLWLCKTRPRVVKPCRLVETGQFWPITPRGDRLTAVARGAQTFQSGIFVLDFGWNFWYFDYQVGECGELCGGYLVVTAYSISVLFKKSYRTDLYGECEWVCWEKKA